MPAASRCHLHLLLTYPLPPLFSVAKSNVWISVWISLYFIRFSSQASWLFLNLIGHSSLVFCHTLSSTALYFPKGQSASRLDLNLDLITYLIFWLLLSFSPILTPWAMALNVFYTLIIPNLNLQTFCLSAEFIYPTAHLTSTWMSKKHLTLHISAFNSLMFPPFPLFPVSMPFL